MPNPQNVTDIDSFEKMAKLLKAFADPMRLRLLQALREKEKNVGELVGELNSTQANISKHLDVLFKAKILDREKRGTATFYKVDDSIIQPLCELVCDKISRDLQKKTAAEFTAPDFSI